MALPTTAPMPVSAVVLVERASTLILPLSLHMRALPMAASVEQPVDRALQIAADTTPVRQAMAQPTTVAQAAVVAIGLLPATPAPQVAAITEVAVVVVTLVVVTLEAADVANQRIYC